MVHTSSAVLIFTAVVLSTTTAAPIKSRAANPTILALARRSDCSGYVNQIWCELNGGGDVGGWDVPSIALPPARRTAQEPDGGDITSSLSGNDTQKRRLETRRGGVGLGTGAAGSAGGSFNSAIQERSTQTNTAFYVGSDQAQVRGENLLANSEDGAITAHISGTVESGSDGRREVGALVARALAMNGVELD